MSLFSNKDIDTAVDLQASTGKGKACRVNGQLQYVSGERLDLIREVIGSIAPGDIIDFETHGAWSNIELLEYILMLTGPATVYFATWSIAPEAITRFTGWRESGQITELFALLDKGIRNRKPEIYQLANAAFPALKYSDVHAKATVIKNDQYTILLKGSANYTKNPRLETGMIICNKELGDSNIAWILKEIYK